MKIVILGQKKQVNGDTIYRTYVNNHYDDTPKMPIKQGETIKTLIEPFPFAVFSDNDYYDEAESFAEYEGCYLLVDADLTQHQLNKMSSGNRSSCLFYDCKMTFLDEFNEPFQYALSAYHKYRKLKTWDLVTWMPHQKIRSEAEFEAMSKIFEIDYNDTVSRGYNQSISFDHYIIPYLPQLVDKPDLKFGDGGYFMRDIETLNAIDTLSVPQLLKFVEEYVYDINTLLAFWTTHPLLGKDWFWHELENPNSWPSRALSNMNERYTQLQGFDWHRLFDWQYNRLQSSDHRDLNAFFHSASIEAAYQKDVVAYETYLENIEEEEEEEDDENIYYDDDDNWYGDDDDVVDSPVDKRVAYLSLYLQQFEDVLTRHDFELKFPEVPAVVWERYWHDDKF